MTRGPIKTHRRFTYHRDDDRRPLSVIRMPYEDFVALHPFRYVEIHFVNALTGEERVEKQDVPEWLVECNRCSQRMRAQEQVYKLVELDTVICARCANDTLLPWCKELN